jgi:hypothetical protein
MTRRHFISLASSGALSVPTPLIVPIRQILDGRAHLKPGQLRGFRSNMWPEAVADFARCNITLQSTLNDGEVRRSPTGQPVFAGLERGIINFVITNRIPMEWDKARGLNGITTRYRGYHLCMIALDYAHPHRIPFLAVNTCVHELLHVLMLDIFEDRPRGYRGSMREFQIDSYATRLWLFHEGEPIRNAARTYLSRLRSTDALVVRPD